MSIPSKPHSEAFWDHVSGSMHHSDVLPSLPPVVLGMVPQDLWEHIERILPPPPEAVSRRADDRAVLAGILFILRCKVSWNAIAGLNCGTAATIRRRLRTWQDEGYWTAMEALIRTHHPHAKHFNWSRIQREPSRGGRDAHETESTVIQGRLSHARQPISAALT